MGMTVRIVLNDDRLDVKQVQASFDSNDEMEDADELAMVRAALASSMSTCVNWAKGVKERLSMIRWRPKAAILASGVLAGYLAWDWSSPAQGPVAIPGRFEFLVVESFDAKYQGDTPGHLGRASLGRNSPRIALDDPVFREATRVGKVTRLIWNEAKESLDVEFDPEPNLRVAIGDPVWVALGKGP